MQKTTESLSQTAVQGGIVLMAAAATLGLVEIPHDPDKRSVVPNQPAFAFAQEAGNHPAGSEEVRREKEEVHPQSHGYGVSQRTPARAGRA